MANQQSSLLVVHLISPSADKVHQAFLTAAAAAAQGKKLMLFFAKGAAQLLVKDGWSRLRTDGGVPASCLDGRLEKAGVADFDLLREGLYHMQVPFYICDQTMKEYGFSQDQFIDRPCPEVISLADIFSKASDANWIVF